MTANMHWQRISALPARKDPGLAELFMDLVVCVPVAEDELAEKVVQLAGQRTADESISAQTLFTAAAMILERRPNRPLMRDSNGRGSDTMHSFRQTADRWRRRSPRACRRDGAPAPIV